MRRSAVRISLVVLATAALLLAMAGQAFGAFLDSLPDPLGTSETNPSSLLPQSTGYDHWWQDGWGDTLLPSFKLVTPGTDTPSHEFAIGMIYRVDRSMSTIINPATPGLYDRASTLNGTNLTQVLDMAGIAADPPGAPWPLYPDVNGNPLVDATQGRWVFHFRWFSNQGTWSPQGDIVFGLDTTAPRAVQGLQVLPQASLPATWVPTRRARISWTPGRYDDLSGAAYYQVYVDGVPYIPEVATNPSQGRVYEGSTTETTTPPWNGMSNVASFVTPSEITIEDMPSGRHAVSVAVVDRAGNVGPTCPPVYFSSDPDTPTISITSPTGGVLNANTLISAIASDLAGGPQVNFAIDGSNIATFSGPPYIVKPPASFITPGVHTITATATDHMGRVVVATVTITGVPTPGSGFIPSDFDGLNAPITAFTTTNGGNDPSDPESWWRDGWGSSMHPDLTFTPPSAEASAGLIIGMLYTVDRDPMTTIDPAHPDKYFRTGRGTGTNMDATLDMRGILNYPPVGGWPAMAANMSDPVEGTWYVHVAFFTSLGYLSTTHGGPIGIDVTPPRAVAGLKASPSLSPTDAATWSPTTRAVVSWTPGVYDDLSGVAYYQVNVDGSPAVPEGDSNPTQGRVYEITGRTPCQLTIENLAPGQHTISVFPVDRAMNKGLASDVYFGSDPDTPTVSFSSPSGGVIGPNPTVSATASDRGGVAQVAFTLDGAPIGTDASAPYSVKPSLGAWGAGAHILAATVTDMLGRSVTASKNVVLDPVGLTVTNFSRTPDPFFPIKRDHYRDNSTISYTLNKGANVQLLVRNSSGMVVRSFSASVGGGKHSFVWDGKWSAENKAHVGKFTYQLTASDSAGNSVTTGKLTTTIKNYQLVKTGKNKVKVIPR